MVALAHWAGVDLSSVTAAIPALICSYDVDHRCRFANALMEEWFGRASDDFIGMHMRDILGVEEYGHLAPFLAQVAVGEHVAFDARSRHRDGTMRDLSIRYVPQFEDARYDGFLAFIFETASHQHRFDSVFDSSPVAYWEVDYSQRPPGKNAGTAREILRSLFLVDLNRAAEQIFLLAREEDVGCCIADLWPSSSEPQLKSLTDAARSGCDRFETETKLLRKDGKALDVLLTCVFPRARNIRSTITFAIIDLTERTARAAAVEALQNEIAHASRVAMLGELTASISHEVNQPLSAIVANGSAALRWLDRPDPALVEVKRSLEQLVGEAKRASEIIMRMRALASKGVLERRSIDAGELLRDVEAIVARQILSLGSCLVVRAVNGARVLNADVVQLQQVFVNLVVNAAQAMANQSGPREIFFGAAEVEGGIRFVVEDTGPGIPEDKIGAVFNAFFTTKATGMGLSVSKTIVEAHGGSITAEARSPHGARFAVRLPFAADNGA